MSGSSSSRAPCMVFLDCCNFFTDPLVHWLPQLSARHLCFVTHGAVLMSFWQFPRPDTCYKFRFQPNDTQCIGCFRMNLHRRDKQCLKIIAWAGTKFSFGTNLAEPSIVRHTTITLLYPYRMFCMHFHVCITLLQECTWRVRAPRRRA